MAFLLYWSVRQKRRCWHATNILHCISKRYAMWHAPNEQFQNLKAPLTHYSKAWECTEMIAAHSKPRCMEHHNFGSVTVYIISACYCLAYCICCRVRLLDKQRLSTWRVCDAPWQEAGGEKGKLICVCVYFWVPMCVKSFWNLSLKAGHMLLLVRHIITQKPPIDSGCL